MVSIVDYESNLAQCKMYIAGFVARAVAKVSNTPMYSIDRTTLCILATIVVLSRASAHPCVSAHPPVLISLLSGSLLRVSAHLVFIPVLRNAMQYVNWSCRG